MTVVLQKRIVHPCVVGLPAIAVALVALCTSCSESSAGAGSVQDDLQSSGADAADDETDPAVDSGVGRPPVTQEPDEMQPPAVPAPPGGDENLPNQPDGTGTPPPPAGPVLGDIITFHTNRDSGDWEIYLSNGDGSYVTRLTEERGEDLNPRLSPNGEQIVFDSTRDGQKEIYIMRRDGNELTRLTDNHYVDEQPVFSPDGTQVAFVSNRDGNREIYTMNVDGNSLTRLTNATSTDEFPAYSPDGRLIFFVSTRDHGLGEIYSVDSRTGARLTRLTKNINLEKMLSVSPDGMRVVFTSNMDGTDELYTVDARNGSGLTRLTSTRTMHEQWPSWSADGKKIFYSGCWAECNVYSMESDGVGVSQLTLENRSEHPSAALGRRVQDDEPMCSQPKESCREAKDCCQMSEGAQCISGVCTIPPPNSCRQEGQVCADAPDCCGNLLCTSNVCRYQVL